MNEYIARVLENLRRQYANEPEYLQSVSAWLEMIGPAADDPRYEKLDLITRMVEPERMFTFLIPWVDDQGVTHTNHGYRVQFNSAIGPYKGGLRFHPSVTPSVVKFLGFEQTYKNALTGLPIGGAAGGADFNPIGRSKREIMRFCQSFMFALYRYIGADTDVPAGDIGVGSREIGYLYGAYKRVTGRAESSALTGKGLTYGGSRIRQEAAGFGTVYFLARMLERQGETLEGKRIIASGFGNMSWGVCRKAAELGVPVMFHSNPCRLGFHDNCAPDKINRMIQVFPDLEVITAHLGGMKWQDALTGCTWVDMSYILPKLAGLYGIEQVNRILRAFGPERLIFATDFPDGEYDAYFDILDQMDFSDAEITQIAWGNIAGLLAPEDRP